LNLDIMSPYEVRLILIIPELSDFFHSFIHNLDRGKVFPK
jgi:hypothetical protein